MQMKRSKVCILALTALLAAACDDATGPGDALTEAEATELAEIIFSQSVVAADQGGFAPATVAGLPLAYAPVNVDNETTVTLSCPLGGSFSAARSVSGTVDTETGAVDVDVSLVQTHTECGVRGAESGTDFTLDGAPNVTSTQSLTTDGAGAFTLSGGISGAVDWVSGDRAGRCEISLEYSGSGDGQGSLSMSLSGRMCSTTISQEVSVTP
jgi:hypothetical protein